MPPKTEQTVVCEKCGSEWFAELTFNRYLQTVYSNAPGGDLMIVGTMPQTIRVCLCGNPIRPNLSGVRGGRQSSGEIQSFMQSLARAKEAVISRGEVDDKLRAILSEMAMESHVEARVNEIEKRINRLEEAIEELRGQLAVMDLAAKNPDQPRKPQAK